MRRKTKIVATLGPAVNSREAIADLITAGMNVARLNFSHGDHAEHARRFAWVRAVAHEADTPIAIMQDIQGPKIRVGTFAEGAVELATGSTVTLVPGEGEGAEDTVHVAYLDGVELQPGAPILLADGLITLRADSVAEGRVVATVTAGGLLSDHKGASFPGARTTIPVVTEKDEEDLTFGLELGFDLVAASFVTEGSDLRTIRKIVGDVPIIAKIESAIGYANLDDILEEADGAMVARGDLGVELSLQSVPGAQNEILKKTNASGKISITATEMLESMISSPRPTRAEVTDVYRSVIDGTDAVMLSAETAIGAYPEDSVRTMDIVCREAEASPDFERNPDVSGLADRSRFASAIAEASVDTANRLDLNTIVAFTETGSTARLLSKYRPHADVYAFTTIESTYRRMAVYGGITPMRFDRQHSTDDMIMNAEGRLLEQGIVRPGEGLVMVAGIPPNQRASTNIMKLHAVGTSVTGDLRR